MPIHPDDIKSIRSNDPSLTLLHLGSCYPSYLKDQDIIQLVDAIKTSKNTHLKTIILAENEIEDEGAKALSTLTTVKVISLGGNYISDEGAKAFLRNEFLLGLDLEGNDISPEVMAEVEKHIQKNKDRFEKKPPESPIQGGIFTPKSPPSSSGDEQHTDCVAHSPKTPIEVR